MRKTKLIPLFMLFWLLIYLLVALFFLNCLQRQTLPTNQQRRFQPIPDLIPNYRCPKKDEVDQIVQVDQSSSSSENSSKISSAGERRILILIQNQSNANGQKALMNFFSYFKVPVRVETCVPGARLLLELDGRPRFSLFVFGDYQIFHLLSVAEKEALRDYCSRHNVGVISFLNLANGRRMDFANFTAIGQKSVRKLAIEPNQFIRIAKANIEFAVGNGSKHNLLGEWTLFRPTLSGLKSILRVENEFGEKLSAALNLDERHVIFGAMADSHWLVRIALVDAVAYLAPNIYKENLERFVQIDIDDVFVGSSGSLLTPDDVRALLATQREIRRTIDNLHFTLGFSGYYFRHGDPLEIRGDEALVSFANEFYWFPHMWRHNHPQEYAGDYLLALMTQNRLFANNVGIPTKLNYAVSPQHSGVYPIYQPLYDAWEQVWSVKVTSTEEYPHLKPAFKRRAFVHGNVTVLPRQTCGLFTHTQFFHAYPDGIDHFLDNIYGGDLFTSIVMNKFSIFMTHQQNFANDRLGTFTFLNLIKFVECWTNLRLKWTNPINLAELYLEAFPVERTLLYTNPCEDPRHKRLLHTEYNCSSLVLPNLIILGPQKTGTSALGLFLALHPNISTNAPIQHSFEELQFFAGPNYHHGINWYSKQFANNFAPKSSIVFEKTANYFDNPKAPMSVHSLLPSAKLVIILSDPVQRAYSWYQHMRAHNDSEALKYSAEQLFTNNFTDAKTQRLKRRCLDPGYYARHLDRWLDYFAPEQLLFVDAHRLRAEPRFVLSELFARLQLPQLDGLHRLLQYSPEKGFYCARAKAEGSDEAVKVKKQQQQLRCLGLGKGRPYGPMSKALRQHLGTHYAGPNLALRDLLRKYRFPIPSFLLSI